jgi:hypothetical protein
VAEPTTFDAWWVRQGSAEVRHGFGLVARSAWDAAVAAERERIAAGVRELRAGLHGDVLDLACEVIDVVNGARPDEVIGKRWGNMPDETPGAA